MAVLHPDPAERMSLTAASAMWALLRHSAIQPESCFHNPARPFHYLSCGSGPPLLLLHGAGGGGANWYRLLGDFAARHRVLAPDLPGFGLSDPLPPRTDLGTQAAQLCLEWLDAMGLQRLDVVGTSFGGLVALRMTQMAPDRVGRIVLLDTVGLGPELPRRVRIATLPLLGRWLQRPTRAGTAWIFRTLLVADGSTFSPEEREALINYLWLSARGAYRTMARALGLFAGWQGQRDVLTDQELVAWRQPTLLLWGARDRFVPPAHGRRAARLMPCAQYHEIEDAGHSPNWERPEEVARHVLRFLAP